MRIVLAVLAALLGAMLVINTAQAQRTYDQEQLDALVAPIALQPDGVVSQVLIASTYPDQVAAAAQWSRANPHLRGDDAVRAVQNEFWDPAVKALVAFPELLTRMADSPQWLDDLGQAFMLQESQVMETVQGLRRRAQAAGNLATTDQYSVYPSGDALVVEPRTQYVYVRYYDPWVAYGPWWWPHYHPVYWRPWAPYPTFVAHGFFYAKPFWPARHVHVVHKPVHVQPHQHFVKQGHWQPQKRVAVQPSKHVVVTPHVRVPEAQRRPIIQQHMPAANGFSQRKREFVQQQPQSLQKHPQAVQQRPQAVQQRPQAVQQRPQAVQQRPQVVQQRPQIQQQAPAIRQMNVQPRSQPRSEPRWRGDGGGGRMRRG